VFKVSRPAQSGGRMRRRALVLSTPLYLLGVSCAAARQANHDSSVLDGSAWAAAAAHARLVDPRIMYSIALVESEVVDPGGRLILYPWTLGYGGRGIRPTRTAAAVRHLAGVAPTTNDDVGLMRVNWAAHHWRVARREDLLEPQTNVHVGSEILRVAAASSPDDWVLGRGRYHSWTERRARWYGSSVWSLYLSLLGARGPKSREG
jgi:hypothetical protein